MTIPIEIKQAAQSVLYLNVEREVALESQDYDLSFDIECDQLADALYLTEWILEQGESDE